MLSTRNVAITDSAGSPQLDATLSLTSAAIPVAHASRASVSATVAGTTSPVLGLKVQVSNDNAPAQNLLPYFTPDPASWIDLPAAAIGMTGDAAYLIPAFDLAYDWIRIVYTVTTAGGGTLTINTRIIGWQ